MPVNIIQFEKGNIEVLHTDLGICKPGKIKISSLEFIEDYQKRIDGKVIVPSNQFQTMLVVECPEPDCDSYSIYPIDGGHDPENIQELFIRVLALKSKDFTKAKNYVKKHTDRFKHEDLKEKDLIDKHTVVDRIKDLPFVVVVDESLELTKEKKKAIQVIDGWVSQETEADVIAANKIRELIAEATPEELDKIYEALGFVPQPVLQPTNIKVLEHEPDS